MKTKDMLNEMKAMNLEKLNEKATELAEEGMKLRFRKKTGQLSQTHQIRRVKKELARALTLINQKSRQAAK